MTNNERELFLTEFGNRVKKYRLEKDMTLEELAHKIGYTSKNARSSVQKIEAGKSDPPASKIRRLAEALEISVGILMGWKEFDKTHDIEQIGEELSLLKALEDQYGKASAETLALYLQLDNGDQGEIRGEIKQMLKSGKYSIQA